MPRPGDCCWSAWGEECTEWWLHFRVPPTKGRSGNMENARPGRKNDMDTTSQNVRLMPAPARNERRFLDDQADNAKTAMRQTLHEIQETALRVADVRSSARQHPWILTGSVMAAGFIAGAVFTHSTRKEETQSHQPSAETDAASVRSELAPPQIETTSWMATIGAALVTAVITVLQSALTAAVVSLFAGEEALREAPPFDAAQDRGRT